MAACLIHRYRGLAVLVRSYTSIFCCATLVTVPTRKLAA